MSAFYEYMERAEQEWNDMDIPEKMEAADPERDRELLYDFHLWFSIRAAHGYQKMPVPEAIHEFLDDKFKDEWVYHETELKLAGEADEAHARLRDR